MAFQLSAGVNVSEIDLTTVVPSVATSTGAFAGVFAWGPVNEIVTISDEVRLAERFGEPNSTNYEHWFTAANFLAYSNNLKVVRAANTVSTLTARSRTTGNVNKYQIVTAGSLATGLPTVRVLGSNNVTATADVTIKVTGISIDAGGLGYANGESLTVTGGTGTSAQLTVTNTGAGGSVTDLDITIAGNYSVAPTVNQNPFTSNTSVAGTGFKANLTFSLASVSANVVGQGYDSESLSVSVTGNGITGAVVKVVDIVDNGNLNFSIENSDVYQEQYSGGANTYGSFAARFPGALGNSLKVSMADANTFSGWEYEGQFSSQPLTSDYATSKGSSFDELHIVVVDEDGEFTGERGTILEKFGFVSKASDAKDESGNSNYYKNVITGRSKYVYSLAHPSSVSGNLPWGSVAVANTYANLTSSVTLSLVAGSDGNVGTSNLISAFDYFSNADSTDVSLLMSGPANETVASHLIDLAESRKDCVVFISPEKAAVVDNYGNEKNSVLSQRNVLTSSSYGVMDCNWKYQFDKYNDVYRWVPLNGDIAGLCARTDQQRDPWFSPGGLNRGIIKNVIKLAWNPTKAERDDLYVKGVNPVVTFPGEGTILYGDKTLLSRPSAFDRINVRRLFIVLEKAIARAARSSLFEFNDQFTRAQFVNLVEPFLRDVQGRRGITDFRVVCDETNNTPEIIDRNEFVGDIYIKPARSINFIQLNFVAVRTGVSFDEIVGKFG